MSLVVFRSRAAGEIYMFAESAQRIFEIIGRTESTRGVITAEQMPEALARLTAAVEADKKATEHASRQVSAPDDSVEPQARGVTLAQRAFPLLEMMRAAQKKGVDITWGV
jgi:hypothetical protein